MATKWKYVRMPWWFFGFCGLSWAGLTLYVDITFAWRTLDQVLALGYSTTHGVVTNTELKRFSGENGESYCPIIRYTYSVAGKEYACDRRRCGKQQRFVKSVAQRILDAYPVGNLVDVHFVPNDPAQAVLQVELEGSDLAAALLTLPINLAMLGFGIAWMERRHRRLHPLPAGGARIGKDGDTLRVQLSSIRPLYVGMTVAGGLAVAAAFLADKGNPSIPVMVLAWCVVAVGGIMAGLYHRRVLLPRGDLILDLRQRRLTIPKTRNRQEAIVVSVENILSLDIEERQSWSYEGGISYHYAPVLVFRDDTGSTRREPLMAWSDPSRTEALVAWLREQLRIDPSGR